MNAHNQVLAMLTRPGALRPVLALAAAAALAFPALAQPMGRHEGLQGGMGSGQHAALHGGGMHGMHGGPGGAGRMGGPGGMMGGLSERVLDQVKATPEQRTQIRQIMESAHKDMQTQHEARRALRDEAARLFTQPNVDAQAVEMLRQKQLAQHDQASRRMTQAMLDASRVLTPDQRKQMADRMQQRRQMMERHHQERRSLETPKS
jgi:periplasmic protein CpxP/Spy